MLSSQDGYCSVVSFKDGELGIPAHAPEIAIDTAPVSLTAGTPTLVGGTPAPSAATPDRTPGAAPRAVDAAHDGTAHDGTDRPAKQRRIAPQPVGTAGGESGAVTSRRISPQLVSAPPGSTTTAATSSTATKRRIALQPVVTTATTALSEVAASARSDGPPQPRRVALTQV